MERYLRDLLRIAASGLAGALIVDYIEDKRVIKKQNELIDVQQERINLQSEALDSFEEYHEIKQKIDNQLASKESE